MPETTPATPPAAESTPQTALSTPPAEPPKADTTLGAPTPAVAQPVALELKLPEGVELDKQFVEDYKKLATEFGIDSPKAQRGLEFVLKSQASVLEGMEKQIRDEAAAQSLKWLEQAKADPEIGGIRWNDTVTIASKAVERFGGNALREALNKTGLGNNPAVIRAFYLAGKAISEDTIGGKGTTAPAPENDPDALLRKLYPTMFQDKKE